MERYLGVLGENRDCKGQEKTPPKIQPSNSSIRENMFFLPPKKKEKTKAYFHEGKENWMGDDSRPEAPAAFSAMKLRT